MKQTAILLSLFIFLYSCNITVNSKQEHTSSNLIDSLNQKSSTSIDSSEASKISYAQNIKPVFGYRFIISGDFNGDGKIENLIEHFYSGIEHKETNKYYEGLTDYEQLVSLTEKKEPISFVSSDSKLINSLPVSSGGQLLGLSYLKNEGDLNADGTDEVSYVVNWADWSNINTWHLVSYKNNKWTELYSFPIWDWQLPDLPETFNQYGLFGLEQKIIDTKNDTVNQRLEKELKNFSGLIKKINANKIQVIYRNEEAEIDTMIVDLKKSDL